MAIVNTALVATDSLRHLVGALQQSPVLKSAAISHSPTLVEAETADGYRLCLTAGFNRDDQGWEAVIDHPDGNQTPLLDGPAADASVYDVAVWAEAAAVGFHKALEVRAAFEAASTALTTALGAWLEAEHDHAAHLLDGGYPFGRSLEDVQAEVAAYVDTLDQRLLG